MKRHIFLFPLLMMTMMVHAEVTHMHVELLSGEEHFAIAQIGKITFANDLMNLYDNDGELLGTTPVKQIAKIVFQEDAATAIGDVAEPQSLLLYPNPTQECLFIRGLEGTQTVRIYNMQGQLLQSAIATDGEASLPVGGLQNGTYLLQAGAQVMKFIKE